MQCIITILQLLYRNSAGNIRSKEKRFKKEPEGNDLRDRRGGEVTEESNSLSKEKVNERDMYKTDREESIVITSILTRQHSVR